MIDASIIRAPDQPAMKGDADLGMRGQIGDLRKQLAREPTVISIQKGDELALGLRQPTVACRSHTAIGLADDAHLRRLALNDFRCPVSRAIIDQQYLDRFVVLSTHATYGIHDECTCIEGRDDDRDQRLRRQGLRLLFHAHPLSAGSGLTGAAPARRASQRP
ncbi:hypothetical protein SDC9_153454 [bioreactor metagenome]|uniref:Uncharacterized protein n=1 Tax=bioreactor metagenome TaxID=1076179 RepID=A0A645EVX6_9ZZZZ